MSTGVNYGARYLAPWLARWISPDSQGVDGLNLYTYVGNNPLKYIDPTGHVKEDKT
jgi:RHS repeat-associated protein